MSPPTPLFVQRAVPSAAPQPPLRPNPEFTHSPVADELVARLKLYQRQPNGSTDRMARSEELVRNAYAVACEAHGKQKRDSGEPYIDHPVAVAHILIDLQLDAASVAAALLHDVLEDTLVSKEQLAALFGAEIANLVDGVTKLSALEAHHPAKKRRSGRIAKCSLQWRTIRGWCWSNWQTACTTCAPSLAL
jgi:guanosine-3',5'-bis(diphosphate) 3'-pyrophosphohydrolase